MFQREERYSPDCNGAPGGAPPPEPQPLSAYDTMWSFPEEDRSLLGWNVVKMGFPNWKRQYLNRLAGLGKDTGFVDKKSFTSALKGVLGEENREGHVKKPKKRIKDVFA